jgi:hypothetical protein
MLNLDRKETPMAWVAKQGTETVGEIINQTLETMSQLYPNPQKYEAELRAIAVFVHHLRETFTSKDGVKVNDLPI